MRVSLNWLKDYVDISMSADELAHMLTMSGLEVETLEPVGHGLEDIVAARLLSVKTHPSADRLFICEVDPGGGKVSVVCGAPNLETGAMVPLALPGTGLPGGVKVKETDIRGQKSFGMLLAEDEMGLSDDHSELMKLPSDLKPGAGVASELSLEDWALDISITPNRPDCTSVIGIAREIAALTGRPLRRPEIAFVEDEPPVEDLTSVVVEDPAGCPRYAAGMVLGVASKPSPFWMRHRLHVSGVRCISNVVDVSNYVLLELGQPLHAFDYDRLRENRIVVKRAEEGEKFTTLDGQTHALSAETLMICDGKGAVAVAGIMGGLNSEIFAGSTNVLIESAYFDPITIRRGSKHLNISTEASYRFERGIDIEGVIFSLQRALMLISQLAGGKVLKGAIDVYPKPFEMPGIDLRIDKTNHFLGTSLSGEGMARHLEALEMDVQGGDGNVLHVKAPTFRVDITREVDLMEEVARMEGYDRIPVTYPAISPTEEEAGPERALRERVKEAMVGFGFTEIISYSFVAPETADLLGVEEKGELRSFVTLLNALSSEQSVMRTSLLPGLLAAMKTNINHGEEDLKLFEWGRIFFDRQGHDLPDEKPGLAGVLTGLYNQKNWFSAERNVGFYDVKGTVEALLKELGLEGLVFKRGRIPPGYDSGLCAEIIRSGSPLGFVGAFSREVLQAADLKAESAFLFELDIMQVLQSMPGAMRFQPFAKFPAVYRDISFVLHRQTESASVQDIIKGEGGELIESVSVFDLYEGKKMDPGEKAMSFRICYRSKAGTLDGKDINQLHEGIIRRIMEKTGGRLREG
ncbi:MAG: phenylalanine--tRNA ligase subunit beta [Deltaproteobacteria bacterium]|nr:phenylalanine--tRNA ligase subunit beta [Deltaproteobacteria bacterium]